MIATTVPTSTVSSTCTLISVSTPAAGAGTSVSILSELSSNRGWSASTVSPTSTSHAVMVPSVTLSPSWGRVTSVATGVLLVEPDDDVWLAGVLGGGG